jgi:transposase InsO family protein
VLRAEPGGSGPPVRPRSSYNRFAAELPNECWQSDFTYYPLASGADAHHRVRTDHFDTNGTVTLRHAGSSTTSASGAPTP